jgi:hypothetical protein
MRTCGRRQHVDSDDMRAEHTVDVTSAKHTSQTNFTPPSLPRDAVFFLMSPMVVL